MAYDDQQAQRLRDDLAFLPVVEKKMMGGLCFMLDGHMLCGVHKGGAMFRVGKDQHAQALALPGIAPMAFTGKPMAGFVDAAAEVIEDSARRGRIMGLALAYVQSLPPKTGELK